jgi:N-acetylglucosaminyldiphosphoundecaprenol N-acetyl-beta-D-mannosaminyltransferase
MPGSPARERILGVSFFNGTAPAAVEDFLQAGGVLVAPASPALINLKYDSDYRRALQTADVVLPDSTLLAILWRIASGRRLRKISGLSYLKSLLGHDRFRAGANAFWLVSSETARENAIRWLRENGLQADPQNFYVHAAAAEAERYELLTRIESRRPLDVIIAMGSGKQEKLGIYLREYLVDRPNIHCIGAALGFLTGEEDPIPDWAERHGLGWFWRLLSQPRMLLPRLGIACALAGMVFKYRSEMPPLRDRWENI